MTYTRGEFRSELHEAGRKVVKLSAYGCLATGIMLVAGAMYGFKKLTSGTELADLQLNGTSAQSEPSATQDPAVSTEVALIATAQAQAQAAGIELPDITDEDIEKYGDSPDQLALGVGLSIYDLPQYLDDQSHLTGTAVEIGNDNNWRTLAVGNLRVAMNNRSSQPYVINTELLGKWFETFGMTDERVTANTPLFYVISDAYSKPLEQQVDFTLQQYTENGGLPQGMMYPYCLTSTIPQLEMLGNEATSISFVSTNALKTELSSLYEKAAVAGAQSFSVGFGGTQSKQFVFTGNQEVDSTNLMNACVIGEFKLGYQTRQKSLPELADIQLRKAADFGSWVEVGEQFTDAAGNFPDPFIR